MLLARHMATSTRNIVTDLLSLETETATGVCARLTHRQCKVTACAAALCTAAISRREEVVSPVCSYSNRICYLMYDVPNIHLESACHLKSMGEELDRQVGVDLGHTSMSHLPLIVPVRQALQPLNPPASGRLL
jgi:hypothetical protein